jgi:hypothetical protein
MKLRVPPTEKNFPGYKNAPKVASVTPWEQFQYIAITLSETLRIACGACLSKITRLTKV